MRHLLTDVAVLADLARLDEAWTKNGRRYQPQYSDVPDGVYEAVVEDAWIAESDTAAGPELVWRLRIPGPRACGRIILLSRAISARSLPLLRMDLEKCGLHIQRLSEMPGRLGEMLGQRVGLSKRTHHGRESFRFRWPELVSSPISLRLLRAIMLGDCPSPAATPGLQVVNSAARLPRKLRTA